MQQHTHPAGLQRGTTMPLALRAQRAASTVADARRIHQPQAAISLATRFSRSERLPSRATQRPIGLEGKVASREAVLVEGQGHLGWGIARGRSCVFLGWWKSWSKFGGAQRCWLQVMAQFQAHVPHPLADDLPSFLPPGGVAPPAIQVLLQVFIGQRVFTRTAMQGERHHIGCCESGLWEVGQAEFVDHASALDTGTRFLLGSRMRRHHAPAALPRWPYLHVRAVVEGAHAVAFRAAELLIGRQVEAGLDLGPVEEVVVFAAQHKRQPGQFGEDGSRPVLGV